MTERTQAWAGALSLAVVACAIYAPAVGAGFFSDDYQWLGRMNATLERPSYVFTVFFRDFNPVLHASFALDWIVGGGHSAVWHADSILLHGIATGLLFLLCSRLGAPFRVAVAGPLDWLFARLAFELVFRAGRVGVGICFRRRWTVFIAGRLFAAGVFRIIGGFFGWFFGLFKRKPAPQPPIQQPLTTLPADQPVMMMTLESVIGALT
ncbi:MAG: hypothetical protein IH848_10440, partial [Acidobacteria bacterium]|nr:hypothetical protein [Acidobacteriota bacterium]